jgi:O-antigen/teichoic acid export membrane protein
LAETETRGGPGSRNTVARGATLMVAMRAISRVSGIFSSAILARLLTPDDFGLVVLGTSVLGIVQMLSELSLANALIRMRNPTRQHYDTAWTLGQIRSGLVAIAVVAAAPYVAQAMHEPRVIPILWTLAAATVIGAMESIKLVDFQIEMNFGGVFRYQLAGRLAAFPVTLGLAFILRSYWALVFSTLATSFVTLIYSYILAPYRPRLTLSAWRDLFDFSKWAVLGTYLAIIDNYTMTFLLGWLGGTRELGVYNVSQQIAALPASEIAAPIRPPLYAAFARLLDNPPELARTFAEGFGFLFLVITPMSLGIFVTAPMVAPLALGPQWTDAPPMIGAVVFYALFDAFGHYPQNLFIVMNRQPRLLALACVFLAIRVPAAIAGGWFDGALGAVYGMVASSLFGAIFWFIASLPLVQIRPAAIIEAIWRATVAGTVMTVTLLLWRQAWPVEHAYGPLAIQLLSFSAVGAAIYIGLVLLLWQWSGAPPGAEQRAVGIALRLWNRIQWSGFRALRRS